MNIYNFLLGENDDFLREQEACDMPFDKQRTVTHIIPEKFKDDVAALKSYIGEAKFVCGVHIVVTLNELLNVVPRKRRRVDACALLVKYLKDELDIQLHITTNRK